MLKRNDYFNGNYKKEAVLLFIAIAFIGLSQGFSENIWTNFYSIIGMTTNNRTLLEPIRELPGLCMMFIIAAISFLTLGRMGAVAMVTRAAGLILVGFLGNSFTPALLAYMVIVSLGDHIFMPLRNSIGISVANSGYEGRVIGLMDATTTVLYILPSIPVLIFFNGNNPGDYKLLFIIGAISAFFASISLYFMHTKKADDNIKKPRFVFKRKFALYYLISFISGMRKQIFLVFAPWLFVTVFNMSVQTMILLNIAGSAAVFFFNPLIGYLIDKYGERRLLVSGGIVCIVLYAAYAVLSSGSKTNPVVVFALLAISFIDRLSQSTLMGRDVFVKHTAGNKDEIMPTLSVGVSMDHIASVIAPVFGGMLWIAVGARWVFIAGAAVGFIYTLMCSLVPDKNKAPQHVGELLVNQPGTE